MVHVPQKRTHQVRCPSPEPTPPPHSCSRLRGPALGAVTVPSERPGAQGQRQQGLTDTVSWLRYPERLPEP